MATGMFLCVTQLQLPSALAFRTAQELRQRPGPGFIANPDEGEDVLVDVLRALLKLLDDPACGLA